jgi:hypothetical protein
MPAVQAQAGFTWKYEPRSIGAADRYGYAIWTVPLAQLSLDGASIPLRAQFSTDPRPSPSPSPLGRGWSINFFSSALVEVNQNSIRWNRPDGRIAFFILERGNTVRQKPGSNDTTIFTSNDDSWTATKLPKKRFITLNHRESGAEFIYEDGLLVRFAFSNVANGAECYSISYNRARRPTRLSVVGTGKLLAEFTYDNPERSKYLSLRETNNPTVKSIDFEYTAAALNQFNSGPYLNKIGGVAFVPMSITYLAEKPEVNRASFERGTVSGKNSLAWDAKTGFILEDEATTYNIDNPSLANGGRSAVDPKSKNQVADYNWRPDEAKVTRVDKAGKSEFRFYDRVKGVLTEKKKDGSIATTSYLLTPGSIYGKVRKVERKFPGKATTIERRAYDDKGRVLRVINDVGDVVINEYDIGDVAQRTIVNGAVTEELYSAAQGEVKTVSYVRGGRREVVRSKVIEGYRVVSKMNGDLEWSEDYDNRGILRRREYKNEDYTLYDEQGREESAYKGGVLHRQITYGEGEVNMVVYDSSGTIPLRRFQRIVDLTGRLVSEQAIEFLTAK